MMRPCDHPLKGGETRENGEASDNALIRKSFPITPNLPPVSPRPSAAVRRPAPGGDKKSEENHDFGAFLTASRASPPDPEAFEERAAIMEYDGLMSRAEAEARAAAEQGFSSAQAFKQAVKALGHNRLSCEAGLPPCKTTGKPYI